MNLKQEKIVINYVISGIITLAFRSEMNLKQEKNRNQLYYFKNSYLYSRYEMNLKQEKTTINYIISRVLTFIVDMR